MRPAFMNLSHWDQVTRPVIGNFLLSPTAKICMTMFHCFNYCTLLNTAMRRQIQIETDDTLNFSRVNLRNAFIWI